MPASAVQSLILMSYIAVGFAASRLGVLSIEGTRGISRLLVNITLPALILSSMLKPFDPALLGQVMALMAVSFGVYGLCIALALSLRPLTGPDRRKAGVFRFGLVFSNVGFMGFPVMESLFGKDIIFSVAVYNIAFQVLAFSVGTAFLKGGSQGQEGQAIPRRGAGLLAALNPNTVAALIGLCLFLLGWIPPQPVLDGLEGLGGATTPLSMIFIGSVLARARLKAAFSSWRIWTVSIFRILLIPTALFFILAPLRAIIDFPLQVPVMVAAMPVAANAAILAVENGADGETASSLVTLSTILSIPLIPLFSALAFGV